MRPALAVGLDDALVQGLERASGVPFRRETVDGIRGEPATLRNLAPVAVVAVADLGVELAQRAHREAECPVFYLGEEAAAGALTAELMLTPGIARQTRSFDVRAAGVVETIADEVRWAQTRAEHRRAIDAVRSDVVASLGAPAESAFRSLGQLFDHAPIGVLVADPTGLVKAANPRSGLVLGWQPRDSVGMAFPSLFSGNDAALALDLVTDCVTTGHTAVELLHRTGPDGGEQHLEVTVAALDPEDAGLGVIILLHDETARIAALAAAEHARNQAEAAADRHAELARTLQQSLLPPALPVIDGFELAARYHAAGDGTIVGGDFYDAFCLSDDRWCLVLGDVSGKGVQAATVTSLARYGLRTAALSAVTLAELLQTLNRVLVDYDASDRFCTVAVLAITGEGALEIALAGHPSPSILRLDGTMETLGVPAPPVGLFDELDIPTVATTLAPGESVVLTSDGVTEARTPSGEFVPDILERVLPRHVGAPARVIADAVDDAVLAVERARSRDDVAILVISRTA